MDRSLKVILVIGVLAVLGLLFINIFYALIALVIVLVLLMSVLIMKDSADYPDVVAALSEDAKGVMVTNGGTGEARNVHVALVPLNIEFTVPSLKVDEESVYALSAMIEEAKAVVTYEDDKGQRYSKSYALSALGGGNDDPFKPVFPIFGRK